MKSPKMTMEGRFAVQRVDGGNNSPMQQVPEDNMLELKESETGRENNFSSSTTCLYDQKTGSSRKVSFGRFTTEALPRLDNYKDLLGIGKRPSLGELYGEDSPKKDIEEGKGDKDPHSGGHGVKLGWIQGVLIPCLLNIWGVMLFLRLSWVVGQSGVFQSLVIIAISAVVCVLTTLSLSALSTNGEVKGGGLYYIISRSLGPEFGASIGIVFAMANAVAASMNTIGFCNSLNDLLHTYDMKIIDGGNNDVRIVGVIAVLIMIIICAVGMEWESKAQNFLIVVIVAAIIDFIAGACVGPSSDLQKAQGFPGLGVNIFDQNWGPNYRYSEGMNQDFFSVFAIFFPSVTGIQAGANISGDLKDPASAIPKGTLLSLLISMLSYAIFVVFAGGAALRDATGNVTDLVNGTLSECGDGGCQYGLMNSYQVMQLMSLWGPLIYAGCFAATLSTALTNLLSVPRLIQALGIDRIYPGLIFFSKGYGKAGEPYRGYVLTFIISSAFVLIAELNVIAPLISNFYLASYALVNFCTFHAAFIKPLGWRPTFKYYNTWLSLFAFFACVIIMFLINWMTSLITFIIIFLLYLVVVYRNPDVNWGSSTQAQTYKTALLSVHKVSNIDEHVKNYRPQVLVLSGRPFLRPALIQLANLITKNNALLVCGDVSKERLSNRIRNQRSHLCREWLDKHKIKAFYNMSDGLGFEEGARALMQATGIGKLKPNVLMMGYKSDWQNCNREDLLTYFNVLHTAFDNRLSVIILRLKDGLDYVKTTINFDDDMVSFGKTNPAFVGDDVEQLVISETAANNVAKLKRNYSDSSLTFTGSETFLPPDSPSVHVKPFNTQNEQLSVTSVTNDPDQTRLRKKGVTEQLSVTSLSGLKLESKSKKKLTTEQILSKNDKGEILTFTVPLDMMLFSTKQKSGTIDVWWLYDDGGLTMLIPYIIHTRHDWSSCKLRVFALNNRTQELETEEKNMANLLAKFRIHYSGLTMVTGIMDPPQESTVKFFDQLMESFKSDQPDATDCSVTDTQLLALQERTHRQLRLREFLLEHSANSSLVVMSLPMPRRGSVSAPVYMAWLEVLTRDLPPFLLIRGNQRSVLTFYS